MKSGKEKDKPETIKKEPVYIGKYEHLFNKRWTENEIKALADEMIDWMEKDEANLWYKDFCIEKRISGQRISEWAKSNEYFGWILSICKELQESRMFKAGTSKTVNPGMYIIGLKNNHGWIDKNDISMSGKLDGIRFFE